MDKQRKKRKNAANSFGWEVFNTEARYRSYKKQLTGLPGVPSLFCCYRGVTNDSGTFAGAADEEAELAAVVTDPSALDARAPLPFEDFELMYGQNDHIDKVRGTIHPPGAVVVA